MKKTFKAYYEGYNFIGIILLLAVLLSFFYSCNVISKSRSVEKKTIDSTTVKKSDSSHTISKDSTATKTVVNADSTGEHHKKDKQIQVNFDTDNNSGKVTSYDYSIGGTIIKSPQKIKSAVIDDNSEDDASTTHKQIKQDSLQVKLLDSNTHSSYDSTKEKKDTKTVKTVKESKRTSPWFIGGIILIIIIAGYFGGRKLGFFR